MKQFFMFAALCAVMFLGSCSDKDDEAKGNLLGTWLSTESYEYINGSWVKDELYSEPECSAGEYYTLTFIDDSHVRVIEEDYDYGTTFYSFKNNILSIDVFLTDWEVEELTSDRMVVLKKVMGDESGMLDERVVFRKE